MILIFFILSNKFNANIIKNNPNNNICNSGIFNKNNAKSNLVSKQQQQQQIQRRKTIHDDMNLDATINIEQ